MNTLAIDYTEQIKDEIGLAESACAKSIVQGVKAVAHATRCGHLLIKEKEQRKGSFKHWLETEFTEHWTTLYKWIGLAAGLGLESSAPLLDVEELMQRWTTLDVGTVNHAYKIVGVIGTPEQKEGSGNITPYSIKLRVPDSFDSWTKDTLEEFIEQAGKVVTALQRAKERLEQLA